jgi:hypothetical protein
MMDKEGFAELALQIIAQGVPEEMAWHYAALIGDTPIIAEDGRVIVMDGDRELARLNLNHE